MRQAFRRDSLATRRLMALGIISLFLAEGALAYNFAHFGGRLGRPGVDDFDFSWDEPDNGTLTWFLDRNDLSLADCDAACFTALKARVQPELDKWALWIRESFAEAPSLAQAEVQIRFIDFSMVAGSADANNLTNTGGTLDTARIRIDPDGAFAWNTAAGRDDFAFLILHEWGHVLGLGDLYSVDHNGNAAGGTFEGEDFCDHGLPGGALPDTRTKADNVMQTRGWRVLDNDEIHGAEWLWGNSGSNGIVTGELDARAAGFNANRAANHHGLSQTPATWTYRGTTASFVNAGKVTLFFRGAQGARSLGPGVWMPTIFDDRVEFDTAAPYEGNFKFQIDCDTGPERFGNASVTGAVTTAFEATPAGGGRQTFPFDQVYGADCKVKKKYWKWYLVLLVVVVVIWWFVRRRGGEGAEGSAG